MKIPHPRRTSQAFVIRLPATKAGEREYKNLLLQFVPQKLREYRVLDAFGHQTDRIHEWWTCLKKVYRRPGHYTQCDMGSTDGHVLKAEGRYFDVYVRTRLKVIVIPQTPRTA